MVNTSLEVVDLHIFQLCSCLFLSKIFAGSEKVITILEQLRVFWMMVEWSGKDWYESVGRLARSAELSTPATSSHQAGVVISRSRHSKHTKPNQTRSFSDTSWLLQGRVYDQDIVGSEDCQQLFRSMRLSSASMFKFGAGQYLYLSVIFFRV